MISKGLFEKGIKRITAAALLASLCGVFLAGCDRGKPTDKGDRTEIKYCVPYEMTSGYIGEEKTITYIWEENSREAYTDGVLSALNEGKTVIIQSLPAGE